MSLFDSLRLPKWQHKDPDVRRQAIAELDDQDTLIELVTTDPDPGVQSAALSRIKDAAVLEALAARKLSPALQSQARFQRLQQLLPQAGALPTALAAISDEASLLHIIHLSDEPDVIAAAIDKIASEETRLSLATQHPQARARLHAAQSIHDLELLNQLMQQSKGHDKAVFRHCKSLLDEAHARDRQAAEQRDKVERLMLRMKELSHSVDSPGYEGQYRSLILQWQAVEATASAEQLTAFQHDQAICGQRLIALREARIDAERNAAAAAAAQGEFSALLAELDASLNHWEAAATLPTDSADLQQLADVITAFESRWREADKISTAPAAATMAFRSRLGLWRSILEFGERLQAQQSNADALLAAVESADVKNHAALHTQATELKQFLARLSWPESSKLKAPETLVRLQQALEGLHEHQRNLDQDQQKLAARCKDLIGNLTTDLANQRPGEADRALAKVRKLLLSMAPKRRQQIEQELAPLAARLKEFHDWQNFAIEPKKESLVARMSALIGNADDVELLALNIQSLQTEWKQLGPLPQAREKALWNQFKAAADEAWKPCKEEFSKQAEIRQQRFNERMKLVKQLQDYEARMVWPDAAPPSSEGSAPAIGAAAPDWQKVQHTLDAARAAFRALQPVDPKADRTSQKAFREICDRIYAHVHAEYQRNIVRKENLVSQARALAEKEDLHQAIDVVKRLQAEWKAAGITPVAFDRKLWKAFRSSCDAVFQRLDQQREAQKSATEGQVQQAESLREQARELLRNPDSNALPQMLKSLGELRSAVTAIDLPPPVQQRLGKEFQAMEVQARDLITASRKRHEQAGWTQLKEAVLACAQVKLAAEQREAAEVPWAELPKGVEGKGLLAFWQQGAASDGDDRCRTACIALEVFGEIESPAEDKAARMNYQLKRLTTGIGNRSTEPGQDLLAQINAFIALRPTLPWVQRFFAGVEKIRR